MLFSKKKNSKSGIILMFHSLKMHGENSVGALSSVLTVADFEEIIKYISCYYQVISIDEFIGYKTRKNNKPDPFIIITFDDGYLDTYYSALPILEKYKVPFTIYITTNFINKSSYPYEFILSRLIEYKQNLSFKWEGRDYEYDLVTQIDKNQAFYELSKYLRNKSSIDRKKILKKITPGNLHDYIDKELFLNWNQVNDLKKHSLVTLGSHTVSHPQLDLVPEEEAFSEIDQSKKYMEEKLKVPIKHFAYPYGGYNRTVEKMVADCEYISAVTTIPELVGIDNDLMALPRKEISSKESIIGSNQINEILIR